MLASLDHGIHDREQLAHARDDDNLGQFPCVFQVLGEGGDVGVMADGRLGGHVQHAARGKADVKWRTDELMALLRGED